MARKNKSKKSSRRFGKPPRFFGSKKKNSTKRRFGGAIRRGFFGSKKRTHSGSKSGPKHSSARIMFPQQKVMYKPVMVQSPPMSLPMFQQQPQQMSRLRSMAQPMSRKNSMRLKKLLKKLSKKHFGSRRFGSVTGAPVAAAKGAEYGPGYAGQTSYSNTTNPYFGSPENFVNSSEWWFPMVNNKPVGLNGV
jgi:hypothetical protein